MTGVPPGAAVGTPAVLGVTTYPFATKSVPGVMRWKSVSHLLDVFNCIVIDKAYLMLPS